MVGVVGGVSPRQQANGQALVVNQDLLSASTALQQAGGGGYQRLVDALQSLDQAANVATLVSGLTTQAGDIAALQTQVGNLNTIVATLQTQVFTLQTQMATANTNISTLQGQVSTLQGQVAQLQAQLDGVSFGAIGGAPTVIAGSIATTVSGTQYLLPLYSS